MSRRPLLALLAVLATSCATAQTPPKLSASFAETFAGLYAEQQQALGRTDATRPSLQTRAVCRRSGPQPEGPGEDWLCAVQYVDGDTEATQSFEVQAKPDGCWKAEGPPTVQPALLRDPQTGRSVVNRLAEFDGCLDTSWR
ncbi:MAG: hypothetical protein JJD92_02895 [Frankiaceae bacterium]|nr:hypothetical protein [Frankiaceae bacterium]